MTISDTLLYIILPLGIGIIALVIFVVMKHKKVRKVSIPTEDIIALFDEENVTSIEYIRNKIVVTCNDYKRFNTEKLKELGATGINIVGNKIKFYYIDNESTLALYKKLSTE